MTMTQNSTAPIPVSVTAVEVPETPAVVLTGDAVLKDAHLTRQFDLIPSKALDVPITIVGVGAIGSVAAMTLAKMGFWNLTIIDYDEVSIENMNCSSYPWHAIGQPKVTALAKILKDYANVTAVAQNRAYNPAGSEKFGGIVIALVDKMEVRKALFETHTKSPSTLLFIDARMGAEVGTLYAVKPLDDKDQETYRNTLYTDAQALQEPCTGKATSYCAYTMASLVAATVKGFVTTGKYARILDLDLANMDFVVSSRGKR